jgi:hypothetical protein
VLRATNMTAPAELHCYRPKPAHAMLDPMGAAVLYVLRDARGIFRSQGQPSRMIHRTLRSKLPRRERKLLTIQAVVGALMRLDRAGFAQRADGGWRATR